MHQIASGDGAERLALLKVAEFSHLGLASSESPLYQSKAGLGVPHD